MPRLDEEWRLGFELEYAIPHVSGRLLPLSSDSHFQDLKVRQTCRTYEGSLHPVILQLQVRLCMQGLLRKSIGTCNQISPKY